MKIAFAYNPTSWDRGPIPGGMADCLVRPVLAHLEHEHVLVNKPQPDAVNVYYTHRRTYGLHQAPPGETSVFVSHGIADKAWRNHERVNRYDHTFVSGPAWVRRLTAAGMNPARIHEVGYAKLDPLFQGAIPGPDRDDRIRVVWAPTHGGGGEHRSKSIADKRPTACSSWWYQDDVVGLLDSGEFDVVVAPHPRHRDDRRSTLAEYVGADVVVADGGSTIYEAWALGIPVVFPTWIVGRGNERRSRRARQTGTMEGHIYKQRLGYHADRPDELAPLVARAATRGMRDSDRDFIEDILPTEHRGISGRKHAEGLAEIAEANDG